MLIIGSGLLLAIGITLLLIQAIRGAYSLLKIAYLLAKLVVYLVVLVVCVFWLSGQWLSQLVVRVAIAIDNRNWKQRYGEILLPPFDD
jgi:hypothetical protein